MKDLSVHELRKILAQQRRIKGTSTIAKELGMTRQAFSAIETRKTGLSEKVARYLGYKRIVVYRKL